MDKSTLICEILTGIYVTHAAEFRQAAKARGVSVESLAAAAIIEALTEASS
jgi:hypothetical protein